jgi:hypothetical protein
MWWNLREPHDRRVNQSVSDYQARATMPLAWVLNTTPAEHALD